MMRWSRAPLLLALFVAPSLASAERAPAFTTVVLGASGGIDEADLTSVLLGRAGAGEFIALDAGTLHAGIERAVRLGSITPPRPAIEILRRSVRAYLISHPHLDHVAGLTIVSPDDDAKPVLGLASTLDALRTNLFRPPLWANFTDEGPGAIRRYHLTPLAPEKPAAVPNTPFSVEAWLLSHGPMTSTAFLVQSGDAYALYLGDTGPDSVEKQGRLRAIWTRIAPLVKSGALRAIFLECSFPDPRPDNQLFGHLTPRFIREEMNALAALVDGKSPEKALAGLTVVIIHIKPAINEGISARTQIADQLKPLAPRFGRLIVPTGGQRIDF